MDLSLLQSMSFAGFLTLAVLLVCSLLVVALGFELRKRKAQRSLDGDWLLAQLRFLLFEREVSRDVARDYLTQLDRPVSRICRELLALSKPTIEAGDYLLSSLVDRERRQLEQGLSHMGTVAVIAPFVGLFGTVVGITKTFADVAQMKKAGIEVVSAGVSEALVATAVGLVVAIVSVVMFNFFKTAFDSMVSEWDSTAQSLLSLLLADSEERKDLLSSITTADSVESAEAFLRTRKESNPEL